MGGKSGQQQKRPSYGGNQRGGTGKSGQPQKPSAQPSGGKGGKSGGQMQAPMYNAMQNGMSAFGQQMQPTENKWQNYAGMTANPAPSMPPQIGAPQTGAFPYPQQPQQGAPIVAQDPTLGQQPQAPQQPQQLGPNGLPVRPPKPWNTPAEGVAAQFQVAPNETGRYAISPDFYNAVNSVLGKASMALPGQYDQGWNSESSPNSRAQAKEWASQMSTALGRPLTKVEIDQLEQRALGWGFNPVGTNTITGVAAPAGPFNGAQLGQDIAAIQAGTAPGMQFQSADPNELNAHQKQWLGIA